MTAPTDQQLKQALAKMLPDKLEWCTEYEHALHWKDGVPVADTELLHICWLIEQTLSTNDARVYAFRMSGAEHVIDHEVSRMMVFKAMNSPWQQRTIALAKVKGIEL